MSMPPELALKLATDPFAFKAFMWPEVMFYDKQREIIQNVFYDSVETISPAGNQLGKDFVAGFIAVAYFFMHAVVLGKQTRIVTTSVAEHHLKVLWAEIGRFLSTSKYPILEQHGGPLTVNYQEVRLVKEKEVKNPMSYLIGRVSAKGEGLAGHHAPYAMLIVDEASGVDDQVYSMAQGWAKRFLIFGNPNTCSNFFHKAVKGGDIPV